MKLDGDLGTTVVILGLARQGKALARFFAERGARVTVSDLRAAAALQADRAELEGLPIRYVLGEHPLELLDGCDLLCLSGGVPADSMLVSEAHRRGVPVSNDAQEFMRRCPALIVGITGSAGKTTTTSLVGAMLKTSGFTTWVGGNIGNPLIADLGKIRPEDRVVMELSSFQLEVMACSPQVAGVLNITPNHLDRHKTMEMYIAAKAHIVAHQSADGIAVLGYDEPNARGLGAQTPARVRYFSGCTEVAEGAFLRGDALMLRHADGFSVEVCCRSELKLRGFHNVMNVLAAIALADAAGASVPAMRQAISSFTGVEHRLEPVRSWRGVLWINDSIATAPERVLAALDSFEEPLVLLAGGRDKNLPWAEFAERAVARVRVLIVFGEAAALIKGHVARVQEATAETGALEEIVQVQTLEQAVAEAAKRARSGDVVLLSPGGTSFDSFVDFAQRGERFRELVGMLDQIVLQEEV